MENNQILNINIGILGHVDSGKTSLVKALSTSLSTAALDKHPQSQQRGITLDLGFSSFTLSLTDRINSLLIDRHGVDHGYSTVQFTLVDCPGHASLIRTIIGGAQIIDMIILVVDANKGIQTQTAECIVIGEITTDIMIIALNKVDLLPENEREERIIKMTRKIKKTLSTSKFKDITIIPISASVGGEKVAAVSSSSSSSLIPSSSGASSTNSSLSFKSNTLSDGIDRLVDAIKENVPIPNRNIHSSFYFAIDHCFPIKGHGTVITGTVLSGSVSVNQMIELPQLQQTRKVKSMQMFHKPVRYAKQGDRLGICITNIDSKLVERGIAATPSSVPLISSAVCMIKKIRFFKFPCKSNGKYHISIGHETVVATAIFLGGNVFSTMSSFDLSSSTSMSSSSSYSSSAAVLSAGYEKLFPQTEFDWDSDHVFQDELINSDGLPYGKEPIQWVLLQFQQPVFCPIGSLIIGSKLDSLGSVSDIKSENPSSSVAATSAHSCRLAFYGPIRDVITSSDSASSSSSSLSSRSINNLGIFIWKQKECEICRLTDVRGPLCYEAIGWRLITEGTGNSIHNYIGMKLVTERGIVGSIVSSYGNDGKFRVKFLTGAKIHVGGKLLFKYKKYLYDKNKKFQQDNQEFNDDRIEEVTKEDEEEALNRIMLEQAEEKEKERQELEKKLKGQKRKKQFKEQDKTKLEALHVQEKSILIEELISTNTSQENTENKMINKLDTIALSSSAVGTTVSDPIISDSNSNAKNEKEQSSYQQLWSNDRQDVRTGKVESVKEESTPEPADESFLVVVVSGGFRMEENVRLYLGARCVTENNEIGELISAFGKLGKCKVKFSSKTEIPVQSNVKIIIEKKKQG
jgi:selenocysteine-specific elongation factor